MFNDIATLIEQVSEDKTVPRNIRERCLEAIKILKNEKDPVDIRINTVISYLDEMSNDPNIPMYTRTQIWNIVSLLESRQK